ncbi:biotin synthase [Thermococcus sp. M39]|uniref:DUF257 family protein n=1 Tax=unclassified Thermococcus TaxID=2627626 RepID=UPI00143A4FED|nr:MULTISPECIES: DUF257 family protein [unclassified Thermococcus]NJE08060.1 biotin synthase [Thermococcus sp. M39]NJE11553.1 biotin synthase [Thermococcus sp. LS2]
MEIHSIEKFLKGQVRGGDIVLIEYPSAYPFEDLVWGKIIPEISQDNQIVIDDFFGIGDLSFRNYIRKVSPKQYKKIIEITKHINVIKIGPGRASYGSIIDEIPLTYEISEFMKNYYDAIRKALVDSIKPLYFLSFGLAEYFYFGKEKALQAILFSRSNLPVEDWTSIYLINKDVIEKPHLAILEDISAWILDIDKEEGKYTIRIKKES